MAFKKTSNKMVAARAFINTWLKDPTIYCNWCGQIYREKVTCCENPQLGTNKDHIRGLIRQNKYRQEDARDEFSSTNDKSLRLGLSLLPSLLHDLEAYFKSQYDEKLFENTTELRAFMREFPQFCIARRV